MKDNKKIPSRYNWIFKTAHSECNFDILEDKRLLMSKFYAEGLKKLLMMFKYPTIPKTISKRSLEMFILDGYAKIFRYKDNWYCGVGSMSGVLSYDFKPISATLVNTFLDYSKTLTNVTPLNVDEINESSIEDYCFIIPNDPLYYGMTTELSFYARMQTECVLTIKMILYNMRVPVISVANDDTTKEAFNEFTNQIINGDFASAFRGTKLFDALKTLPYNNQHLGMLKEVIECMQYLKATFENNIGLNANYNMKRESLNDDEISLNDDNLTPTIDEMKESRDEAYKLLNDVSERLFGEKVIEFEFASAWANRQKEIELEFEKQEAEIDSMENQDNTSDEPKDDENNGGDN